MSNRRTPESIQYEIDLLKGEMVEVRNWEIENARTTLLTFGFKYSELIPIVVKYEKLIERVRLMMPLEAIKSTETHENY